jgi:[ribosomal protein S5]-alanine N-acetyltransferase
MHCYNQSDHNQVCCLPGYERTAYMKDQELLTNRLALRALQSEHAEGLLPIWNDSDVVRFTYMRLVKDMSSCVQNILNLIDSSNRREDVGPYVIMLGSTVIGMAGAVRMSRDSGEHEVYYHLGKPWWGKGYASEAASAVIDSIYSMPLVHRVSAEVVAENIASIKVLEKAGMKQEGRLRGKFFKDGIYRDLFVYSILRNEWQQKKAQELVKPLGK